MSKIIKTESQTLNMYLESIYIQEFWDQNLPTQKPWNEY